MEPVISIVIQVLGNFIDENFFSIARGTKVRIGKKDEKEC